MPFPSPYYGSDYVVINSGATFAVGADPVTNISGGYSYYVQYYKMGFGATGAFTPVTSSNPFPVTVATGLTATISGFSGPISIVGTVGGQAVTVGGSVVVSGLTSSPVYVQTAPSCRVEVTGGRYLSRLNDSVSVFGPSGSTWLYANLVDSTGTPIGSSGNPMYTNIIGATISVTINPTVGVTNQSGTALRVQGFSGGTSIPTTVGNTVGIYDTNITNGLTAIYGAINTLNTNLGTLGISRPTTFISGRSTITTGVTGIYPAGYTTISGINIKASSSNTDIIYINSDGVAALGYELDPGQNIFLDVQNLNTIYLRAKTSSQIVSYMAS
jgi:hypothetical protein